MRPKPYIFGNYFDSNTRTVLTAMALAKIEVDMKTVNMLGLEYLYQQQNDTSKEGSTTDNSFIGPSPGL